MPALRDLGEAVRLPGTGDLSGLLFGTLAAYYRQAGALIELPLPDGGPLCYIGLIALAFNLTVTLIFTLVSQAVGRFSGEDHTRPDDYHAEVRDGSAPLMSPGRSGPRPVIATLMLVRDRDSACRTSGQLIAMAAHA